MIKSFLNKIIHGNCLEILNKIPENSIDLTVTSPPYDNLRSYKGFDFKYEPISELLYKVTKEGGVVVWIVGDATINGSETGTSFRQALQFQKVGFNIHDTMIFKKKNPIPQIYRKRYSNEFEYMFVFSKGYVLNHNPIKVDSIHAGLKLGNTTYKNYSKKEQKRSKLANPVKSQKIKGNIWEYVVGKKKEDQEAKNHPAPFPCELAEDHILSWTNENDIVFDPMCGSGTTCRSALKLNRKYIGIDISKEYCELAKQRIDKFKLNKKIEKKQLKLIS
jgi:DNA modification methylase